MNKNKDSVKIRKEGFNIANPNAVKFFSAVELIELLADREWLDDATKTIGQFWKRKNARRNGLILKEQADIQLKARSA